MNKKWIFALTCLLISACGDSAPEEKAAPPPVKKEETVTPKKVEKPKAEPKKEEKAAEATVTVSESGEASLTIEANDAMQFNSQKFTVTAGQKVKLTLKHTGTLPKEVMGHNIVILKPGVNTEEFVAAAQLARDNDYFPKDKADQVVAYSKLLGGGESVTIEFVAPEAGTYQYICSYSSHWYMMKGEMIVTAKK